MYKILVAIAEKLVIPQEISRLSDTMYNKEIAKVVFELGFGLTVIMAIALVVISFKIIKKIEARK